jgi:hypothetical protein
MEKGNDPSPFVVAIDDEDDIHDLVASHRQDFSQVLISVKARGLSEAGRERIESEVRKLLSSELGQSYQGPVRAAPLPKQPEHRVLPVPVSLEGLELPEQQTRRVAAEVSQLVSDLLSKEADRGEVTDEPEEDELDRLGSLTSGVHSGTCACATRGIPGHFLPLGGLIDIVDSLGPLPRTIAFFPSYVALVGWPYAIPARLKEDALLMRLEDGAGASPPLARTEMAVGFISRLDWEKEIMAFSQCRGRVGGLVHRKAPPEGSAPSFMRIFDRCGETDTLVFRKAKFLGHMVDMYHWEHERFWRLFGGKVVTYTWVEDAVNTIEPLQVPPPVLRAPEPDSRFLAGQTVRFNWTPVFEAQDEYDFQFDTGGVGDFSSPRGVTVGGASELSLSTLPRGTIFWRVRAVDQFNVPGQWSASRRLFID